MADLMIQSMGNKKFLPPLAMGELGWANDTRELFIGTESGNFIVNKSEELYSLTGKTINIFGDSISANSDALWPNILRDKYNCTVNNFSTSGILLTGPGGMAERINAMSNNGADINIVFVGTNDWAANVALGNYLSTSTDNIFGAINTVGLKFAVTFPNAKNYICSTLRRNGGDSLKKHYNLSLLNSILYNSTKWYANQFIDMYNNLQFANPGTGILRNRWFTDDTHPNKALQPYIADYIATKIITNSSDSMPIFKSHLTYDAKPVVGETMINNITITSGGNICWRFSLNGGWTVSNNQVIILDNIPEILRPFNASGATLGTCYYTGNNVRPCICFVQGSAINIVAPDALPQSNFVGTINYVSNGYHN